MKAIIISFKLLLLPWILVYHLGDWIHEQYFVDFFYDTKILLLEPGRAFVISLVIWFFTPMLLTLYRALGIKLKNFISGD